MLPLHVPILGSRTLHWPDEAACAATATAMAAKEALRDALVALDGPLGAGKTTFVRHLLRALGVTGRIRSPSYAVVEPHQAGGLAISHFDFYRFSDPRELEDAGLRELFAAPGLKLCEWPGHAGADLPQPDLTLRIEPDAPAGDRARPDDDDADTPRTVTATAWTQRGVALLP
jgi:tRNA threonylcarbamoyladenosine biosynthesis protein TsaE